MNPRLILSEHQLSGTVPQIISTIADDVTTAIYLEDNELTGQLPDIWDVFSELTALHLEHNRLEGSIPASIGSLHALQSLDLSMNQLTGPY